MRFLLHIVLSLFSWLYGAVVKVRNLLYDEGILSTYRSSLPVISVGNITAGGNGKTPLTLFLAAELKARGHSPVILSRGYGGSLKGPKLLADSDLSTRVGDEPLMLAREKVCAVVVAKDRVSGAKYIEKEKLGDLIILDDGFQHRRLARQVDMVCVDVGSDGAIDSFLEGKLLPAGFFREDRAAALRRANFVVFVERKPTRDREVDTRLLKIIPPNAQIYRASLEVEGIFSLDGKRIREPKNAALFCAIAKPESFVATAKSVGLTVDGLHPFSDHYHFKHADILRIAERYPTSLLLCTAKDAVKLSTVPDEIKSRIAVLKTKVTLTPRDAFVVQITRRVINPLEAPH